MLWLLFIAQFNWNSNNKTNIKNQIFQTRDIPISRRHTTHYPDLGLHLFLSWMLECTFASITSWWCNLQTAMWPSALACLHICRACSNRGSIDCILWIDFLVSCCPTRALRRRSRFDRKRGSFVSSIPFILVYRLRMLSSVRIWRSLQLWCALPKWRRDGNGNGLNRII